MKKVYSLTLVVAVFVSAVQAQTPTFSFGKETDQNYLRTSSSVSNNNMSNFEFCSFKTSAAVDTAGLEYLEDNLTTYVYQTSTNQNSYMFGNNSLQDKEFAQIYPYFGSGISVEQVLVRFAVKAGTGSIKLKAYNVVSGQPSGSSLSTTTVDLADIDTASSGNFTVITPATAVNFASHFAVSVDISSLYSGSGGNGVALLHTVQDGIKASENARIKWKDNSWNDLNASWNSGNFTFGVTNCNFIILPVVSESYETGIEEINGIKLTQSFPNPSNGLATVEYQIKEPLYVSLQLIDVNGKVVLQKEEGVQAAGQHKIMLDISYLPKGSYFYSLTAGDKAVTKKMILQ